MKTKLKISTLLHLATGVEQVLGVQVKCTYGQMQETVTRVAGASLTKEQAVRALAEEFGHPINGDYPATDAALLSLCAR